ncbi:alkene reductase [Agrobacterium sp. MOPV5]|uniref:alkene reductase n=1 Tax=Agrobacterium leguminum TaxID=2792015 RepID=UPI0018C263A8|nr:alkene reductase [Agrobacterium leguminum]MBG0510851.1 alkene reductase [Agrobacterium leguminum]
MNSLFEPYDLAGRTLRNRFVMAPMTRARAKDGIADAETALYYRQRATAGLIVTEGTPISQEGQGFAFVPGIWSEAQVDGWRGVTDAVHAQGGTIFAQIWHVGRMSHTSLQPGGKAPVSSTGNPARDANSMAFAFDESGKPGFVETSVPRALGTEEVRRVVNDFADAAANADRAGFDGVEIHGANGYLLEQFLNPTVNDRTDRYGAATLEDRTRFLLEVVDAAIERIGSNRVAIRLSPYGQLFQMGLYPEIEETYLHVAAELSKRDLAYVHIMDQASRGASPMPAGFLPKFRAAYSGTLILAGGLDLATAEHLVRDGLIDLPAFGEPFIANPDLVARFRHKAPLASADRSTFYGGDARGYTDYPVIRDEALTA